jgi:hypothetical protein
VLDTIIRSQLQIDYIGSGSSLVKPEELAKVIERDVRPLVACGEIVDGRFHELASGRLKLWFKPNGRGEVPIPKDVVIGVDISRGVGNSNSAMVAYDKDTRAKIAELADPHEGGAPADFALTVTDVGKWLSNSEGTPAKMIWEANGPGLEFGLRVKNMGYGHFYREGEQLPGKKVDSRGGWWSTPVSKPLLLNEYARAVVAGECVNRSRAAIAELGEYVYDPSGRVTHQGALTSPDPAGARENHGDIATADACAWHILGRRRTQAVERPETIPPNSYAARRARWKEKKDALKKW